MHRPLIQKNQRLVIRPQRGAEAKLIEQRRALRLITDHLQRRPLAALDILLAQAIKFARLRGHFAQRRIVAAHIIHQMHQAFQRRLIELAVQRKGAKLGARQQRVQRHLLRLTNKFAPRLKHLGGAARFPFKV